jgi:hypothetical protein
MAEPAVRRHVQNAVKKALETGLASEVRRLEQGRYLVPSTSDAKVTYVVTGSGVDLDCTCQAAEHLPFCVHRAAVAIRRLLAVGETVEIGADGVALAVRRTRVEDLVCPPGSYASLVQEAPPPGRGLR